MKIMTIEKLTNPLEEVDKKTKYLMTKNKNITFVKDLEDGTVLNITHMCEFEDTNNDGVVSCITSYMLDDGSVVCTQSETFKNDVDDIRDIFENENISVVKKSGKTKAGRNFVYAVLA